MTYQLGNFDYSMQSGHWVIPKITFANLCKPNHGVIVITVSSDPFNLEIVEKKAKKLHTIEYLKNEKKLFR